VRADMNVPAAAKVKLLVKDASAQTEKRLKTHDDLLKRMARLETVETTKTVPPGSIQTVLGETTLIIPVADLIDLGKERARLEKEIAALNANIQKTMQKLGNKDFVDRAPPEVIEEHQERRAQDEQTLKKLEQALSLLKTG
jgi:valyl-tRNA synthetase